MNSRFFITLILVMGLNLGINFLFDRLIPNAYLARILASITLAFAFAFISEWEDRIHFYKHQRFWYDFFIIGIIFCLFDLFVFILR